MRIIRESYSPEVLEDLVSSYRDFYSPEEHRSIWKEIIHDYHDEELANDVLAALEDEYDQYGPGYMREGVDKKYYVKINGQYLKGKNKFSKKPVYFETDEEPTQIINQMKKDGTLSKNAKPKVKSIKEHLGDDFEDDFDYDGEMEDGFDPNINGIENAQEAMWMDEYEDDLVDTGIPVYKRGIRKDSDRLSDEYLDMIASDCDEEIVKTPFGKRFISRQVKEDISKAYNNRDYIHSIQRIGDVQFSWNESRKRSGHVKESKIVSDDASEYQFEKKLLQFFDDYLAQPIVKAKTIKGDKPKPFTYREWKDRGSYFYEVSLFGEYEDDVIIELHSAVIGGGCAYRLLTGDGSKCEHWMGMSLDEFERDLNECFKIALGNRGQRVTESKKIKEFRPSKFRYDLDKQVSNKERWNLKMDIESLKKKLTDLQNTTSELPDEYVSDLCDTDSYPFDDDIDNETSLGDWCNEVDDFLTNALQLEDKGQWI